MRIRLRVLIPLSTLVLAALTTTVIAATGTLGTPETLGGRAPADRTPLPSGFVFPTPLPPKTPGPVTPIAQRTPGLDAGRIQAWYAAGQALRVDSAPNARDVIAKVGAIEVERRHLTSAQVLAGRTGGPKDLKTLFESMKTPLAVEAEAIRRGFVPSAADLATFLVTERSKIHRDGQGAAEWAAFFSGLGVSEDEYFALPDVVQELSYQWSAGRLHDTVTSSFSMEQRESAWSDFVSTLRANAPVTILDPSLR